MMRGAPLALAAFLFCSANGAAWFMGAQMPTARSDHSCVALGSTVYMMGGCSSDQVYEDNYSACSTYSARLDAYNVDTNTWTRLANMPRERYRMAAAATATKIYVFGGIAGYAPEVPVNLVRRCIFIFFFSCSLHV